MARRRMFYQCAVIFTAFVMTLPQMLFVGALVFEGVSSRRWPLPSLPGVGRTGHMNPIYQLCIWQDRLVHISVSMEHGDQMAKLSIIFVDPESGAIEKGPLLPKVKDYFQKYVFGSRLFLVSNKNAWELVDGELQKSKALFPVDNTTEKQQFLLDGQPAIVQRLANGHLVSVLKDVGWTPIGTIPSPETDGFRDRNGQPSRLIGSSSFQILNSEEGIHVFMQNDGRLFYRHGLDLKLITNDASNEDSVEPTATIVETSDSATTPQSEVRNSEKRGWLPVREQPAPSLIYDCAVHGLMIKGKPAALIIDGIPSGQPIGRLFRLEDGQWIEFAVYELPFGSTSFVSVTTQDRQRSYLACGTSLSRSHFIAVDESGFHRTSGPDSIKLRGRLWADIDFAGVQPYLWLPPVAWLLGVALGSFIWGLMRFFSDPMYQFGVNAVQLASPGKRGCARSIDMGLIGGSTIALGWLLLGKFDWFDFGEALNLHVSHSTIPIAIRTLNLMIGWLIIACLVLICAQARWGITPGKWICGVKTVRTTLRPIGFIHSLARELVFFVDCGNLLCWTPGILSIALTDHRQRLGDIVADTIVVDSRSLLTASTAVAVD